MSAYTDYILTKSPEVFYPMQEENNNNTAEDISGNGHDGTYMLGSVTRRMAGPVDDYAVLFENNGQIRNTTYDTSLWNTNAYETSCEVWFKLLSWGGSWGRIISIGNETTNSHQAITRYSSSPTLSITSFGCSSDTGHTASNTEWIHMAMVKTDAKVQLYVNGVASGPTTTCIPTNLTLDQFTIGGGTTGEYANTIMSHFAIYNRAISPAEMLEHYQVGLGIKSLNNVTGNVRVGGMPRAREIHAINRATGQLMGTGISDPVDGYYNIPVTNDDECYVVVLEDPLSNRYEGKVRDHVFPQ